MFQIILTNAVRPVIEVALIVERNEEYILEDSNSRIFLPSYMLKLPSIPGYKTC